MVFQFTDYKAVIRRYIKEHAHERGYQGQLARAASCQPSYLSQVLHSELHHLNPDQATGLATFWRLSEEEADYLLDLVNWARASSPTLKRRLEKKIRCVKQGKEDFSIHYQRPTIDQKDLERLYYSSWQYSAIHILLSIPAFRKVENISKRLHLDEAEVLRYLGLLEEMGLVAREGGQWTNIPGGLYLPKRSPLSAFHHANWRQKAVLSSQLPYERPIHFTEVCSHSQADEETLRNILSDAIEKIRKTVKPSKEEVLSCFCLDFFPV